VQSFGQRYFERQPHRVAAARLRFLHKGRDIGFGAANLGTRRCDNDSNTKDTKDTK
jgi:hypothetical protein